MKGFFSPSHIQTEKPESGLIAKCGSCGLHKTCQSPKMAVYGQGVRQVLVVGEAPGRTEDEEGRPFVGKAGQYFRQTVKRLGYSLDRDAWTTNAVICRPPGNKTPDDKQIASCRPNLLAAKRLYNPRVIIVLGRSALVSLLSGYWEDVGVMERWTGWKIPLQDHWLCPTFHPNYLLRMNNPLLDRLFEDHLEQAFSINRQPPALPDFQSKIELVYDDMAAAREIKEISKEGGWVAVDYETNCLKPEYPEARIFACSMSNGHRTIAYPWQGAAIEATGKFWRSEHTSKIASNMKFEDRWTRKMFGFSAVGWGWDTMLAAHCLDNRQGITSLKFQSFVRMGVPIYNRNIDPYLSASRGHYNRIEDIDLRNLLFYNGMDSILEWRLAKIQRKDMGFED